MIILAYSIAIWDWTPDTWTSESGEGSISLALLQDGTNKVVKYDNGDWVDTLLTTIDNEAFENHGFPVGELNGFTSTEWGDLYDNFTPPFKIHLFKEEDGQSQPKVDVTISENEYTMARSYEVEISESDLQKIKTLSVI